MESFVFFLAAVGGDSQPEVLKTVARVELKLRGRRQREILWRERRVGEEQDSRDSRVNEKKNKKWVKINE